MKYTYTFVTIFASFLSLLRCDLLQSPIVGMEMSESGFHRDLLYSVQFDYPLAGKDCEYVLEQPMPAAVYVSVDQLDDLRRLKKLNALYPNFVNVELPTEKAEAFKVLLKGTPKITESIKLPIHFRYHAPSDNSSYAIVDIKAPQMYITCPDNDDFLIDNVLQATPNSTYCLNEAATSFEIAPSTNENSNIGDCNWKLFNVDFQFKSSLSAKIPIGNTTSYPPILYATIVLSWVVSLWTVFRTSTNRVPRRINHKLEQERILQNSVK